VSETFAYRANRVVEADRYKVGDRVVHTCYGVDGTVISANEHGMSIEWDEPIEDKKVLEYK
jgi:predicted methyltransferase